MPVHGRADCMAAHVLHAHSGASLSAAVLCQAAQCAALGGCRGGQLDSLRGELEQRAAQVARYDKIFMEKMEADRRRQAMVGLAAAEAAARLPPPVPQPLPPQPPCEPEPVQKPEPEVLATRQSSLAAAPSMAPPVPPKKQRLVKPKVQSAAAAAALAGRRAAKLAAEQERQQQIEDEQIEPLFTGTPPAR